MRSVASEPYKQGARSRGRRRVRADPRRRRRADAVAGYGGAFFDGDEPMAELAIMLIADARAHLLTGSVNVA
jgi:hypothetical protein